METCSGCGKEFHEGEQMFTRISDKKQKPYCVICV